MDLEKRLKAYIREQGLTSPGDLLLLAVSGGVDSMCLAHLLLKLKDELGVDLAIAHFDHQLRPESAEEGRFVAEFARRNGLLFFPGTADIRALGGNVEDTARRERYAFLRRVASRIGAASIVLAHHADDQAETLLLHLLRGCGLAGLAAMSPAENGLIRPLLFARRGEIEAYAAACGIEYREDASNADTRYLRNRIRHELLPYLADYNPHITESLNATAEICRAEDELLSDMAQNALAEVWIQDKAALDKDGFDQLPVALRRRVARKVYTLLKGERREPDFGQTEALLHLKDEGQSMLPGGLKAYLRGDIFFGEEVPPLPLHEEEIPLTADGRWHTLADWGWEYQAGGADNADDADEDFSFVLAAAAAAKLYFRTRRKGDKLRTGCCGREKKLKDIFIEAHIPIYQRAAWPLLCLDGDIVWVPGLWERQQDGAAETLLIKIRVCGTI